VSAAGAAVVSAAGAAVVSAAGAAVVSAAGVVVSAFFSSQATRKAATKAIAKNFFIRFLFGVKSEIFRKYILILKKGNPEAIDFFSARSRLLFLTTRIN
jgi:hypothetical protein